MAPFDRPRASSYSSFIAHVSSTVIEICSVEYWRDLEILVTGGSGSLKMVPIDRSYTTLYWYVVVTIAILHHFRVI